MSALRKVMADQGELDVEKVMRAVITDLSDGSISESVSSQVGFAVDRIQREREAKHHFAAIKAQGQ